MADSSGQATVVVLVVVVVEIVVLVRVVAAVSPPAGRFTFVDFGVGKGPAGDTSTNLAWSISTRYEWAVSAYRVLGFSEL